MEVAVELIYNSQTDNVHFKHNTQAGNIHTKIHTQHVKKKKTHMTIQLITIQTDIIKQEIDEKTSHVYSCLIKGVI